MKKVALVTGGSGGIGSSIVEQLRGEGWLCWSAARRLVTDVQQRTLKLDVTRGDATKQAFGMVVDHDGQLDALILAHGGGFFGPIESIDEGAIRADFESHVLGTLHCLRAAREKMKGGLILAVGSIAATTPLPDCASYGAAKSAQRMLLLDAAEELKTQGFRFRLLSVGAVATSIWSSRPGFDPHQMLTPGQVAERVAALLSESDSRTVFESELLPAAGVLER